MQKVTAFLEQHVQWIAIGLGALFCLYMTYSYVITPPAEVTIGSETYGPSEIDPYTAENVVAKLQSAMQNNAKIKMEVPQYVQAFQDTMTWKSAQPVSLAGMTDPSFSLDVPLPPPVVDPTAAQQPGYAGDLTQQQAVEPGAKLAALPVPPKPRQVNPDNSVKYGRSVIVPPPAPGQAAVEPAPGVVPPGAVDKDWVTQMWSISMGDLDTAFRNAGMQKLPPELRKTMFLHVEMVRQEMVDGEWDEKNQVVIQQNGPTRNNQPRLPFPGGEANPALRQAQFQYAAWASTSTPDIIQPLFHVTVPNKGDAWTKPGAQMAVEMFNPATHVGGRGNLTDEQWQEVLRLRREQQRLINEQKKQQNAPRGPRTPGGGRPGGLPPDMEGEGMYAPLRGGNGAGSSLPHYAPAPGRPIYPGPRGGGAYVGPPDIEMIEGEYGGAYGGGVPQAPGMPQPGTDYPNGEFDPSDPIQPPPPWKFDPIAQKPREVEMWAHDDNVQAGKTYRYKVRYHLKNPIFGSANAATDPALSNQFALTSEFSDWTTPVTVPSLVNFFVAGGVVGGRGTVAFEIFRWDEGQQKSERFEIGPGDPVGGERNGVDFSTDWTVVDFRADPRANDPQILLVNNKDGKVIARSFQTDNKDKLYQALKAQVKSAAEAAAAAAGTAAAR